MGTVYDVFDHDRGERVALKVLRSADPETIYRFKQEFRSLTDLVHRNLLSLYELFLVDGRWHFTMELLDDAVSFRRWVRDEDADAVTSGAGTSAAVVVDQATVTGLDLTSLQTSGSSAPVAGPTQVRDEQKLRAAMQQLVEGVMALHAAGMLHRDLKPENVLVTPDGRVRLLDFGLIADLTNGPAVAHGPASGSPGRSSRSSRSSGYMHQEHVAGTVHYMSPEQASAQPLTTASDWYAVGVMLYEALTGQRPFTGPARDVLEAKQASDPIRPSVLVPGVPDDLDALCVALLSRQAGSRPLGREILARLRGAAAETPVAAAEAWESETPFVGRHEQLGRLNGAFDRARSNVVVCRVHGRSGAGKSTLVSHFLDAVSQRHDVVVLTGRCYEQESVPYKAWDSLLDSLYHYLERLPAADLAKVLPSNIDALARVFPVMKRLPGGREIRETSGQGADLREQRILGFQALGELLGRIAERHPLVLSIDDLQWGDVDSAQLLVELLRASRMARVLVLIAHRSESPGRSACLDALMAAEHERPASVEWQVVEVPAMAEGETLQLALALLGSARPDARDIAERILKESGGNAFFIIELARHVRTGLNLDRASGLDLDAVLWSRVQLLDAAPRRLLETVAVAGLPVRVRDAALAAGFDSFPQQVVIALRTSHFVRTTGPSIDDQIECYHDRIRESVAARLDRDRRLGCHARLSVALEASGVAEPQMVAVHLAHSEPARAATYYAKAGEAATDVLAFERAEEYFRLAAELAGSTVEKAEVLERLIHFYADLGRFRDAYDTGRTAAASFGARLPANFIPPAFLLDLARARWQLGRRRIADISPLPELADERRRWVVRIISATAKSAFQIRPELCVAISTKAVTLCLRHGTIGESAVPFMVFGSIFLGGVLGRYETGYEYGRVALDLVERYNNRTQRAEVRFVVGYFGTSWLRPAIEAEALWQTAHAAGLESGDLFHTGCSCAGTVQSQLMRGAPLDAVLAATEQHAAWLARAQQRETLGCVRAVRQTIACLKGTTAGPASFDDETFDEAAFVKDIEGFGSKHFAHFYFVDKMLALYLRKQYAEAARLAASSAGYLKASAGMLHSTEHIFLDALIAGAAGSPGAAKALKKAAKKFAAWASRCPANFAHKQLLLAGEAARVAGNSASAAVHYAGAIAAATESGYLQVIGMAHERWAEMAAQEGHRDEAAKHRAAAREAWTAWGATSVAAACTEPA